MLLKIFGVLGILVLVIVLYLLVAVRTKGRKRDEKIIQALTPLMDKLITKIPVSKQEVASLASPRQNRPILYEMLKQLSRLDLFPEKYLDSQSQAEGFLAHWLMHPNEMGDVPAQMELVETVIRKINGADAKFHVMRYKMADSHWAAKDGWMLGLAGPYFPDGEPYLTSAAFSRFDKIGDSNPLELIDWYIRMRKWS